MKTRPIRLVIEVGSEVLARVRCTATGKGTAVDTWMPHDPETRMLCAILALLGAHDFLEPGLAKAKVLSALAVLGVEAPRVESMKKVFTPPPANDAGDGEDNSFSQN